ncbi:putative quinate permease [Frankliniella fusca]|uniref:Quinate permease n=1 Tax=Frankliniella fusca TaxID=407009 RepID=A0AAE1HUP8_9NEOP|nr:putative quinate permease [Frankliniella fusca]
MALEASLGRSYEWDAYEDVDKPARGGPVGGSMRAPRRSAAAPAAPAPRSRSASRSGRGSRRRSPQHHSPQGYSNEALVDGDEYFSDQTDYEEHCLARRQRQDSGTSLTSRDAREPPVGASPVHAAPGAGGGGGFEGIATYEQRRTLAGGKSMPSLSEQRPQPQPRHRYEAIPQRGPVLLAAGPGPAHAAGLAMQQQHPPPQQPPPPPHRPSKATPTRRCNSSASTPPRRAPVRSPSAASLLRRGAAAGLSTPAARYASTPGAGGGGATPTAVLSSPATSPLRLQQQQQTLPFVSPSTSRRNLTPLMNSMSPQPLPRTPRQQQPQQQYNHRRTGSMSGTRTAVIAPNTYTGYDLSGRAYGDGSRPRCELEDDMAEMQASFLSQQQSSLEPLMRRSPRRKSLSPGPSTPLTPPPSMDMQQLACSRGALGPALRPHQQASPACSPASYKSNKSSWLSLPGLGSGGKSLGSRAPRGVLFGTGIVLLVSGVLTTVLAFYILSQKGRQYYLDFGVLSAFASLMLGIVGLRSRVGHLLPNRNYVTGYILVALFSVLTAAGLVAMLLLPAAPHLPRSARLHGLHLHGPAAALDITAGAVCGTAALTLLLAATGTLTSYCCRYPPPDNRVAHAAEGFSV